MPKSAMATVQASCDCTYSTTCAGGLARVVACGADHDRDQPGDEAEAAEPGEEASPGRPAELGARHVESAGRHVFSFCVVVVVVETD